MIVAKIMCGLGNQLRIFSCGYTVSRYMNQPLVLDISDYTSGYFRPYLLDTLLIPEYEKIYYPHEKAMYYCINAAPGALRQKFDLTLNTDNITDRAQLLSLCDGHSNIYIQGYKGITFCTDDEKETLKKWFFPRVISQYASDLQNTISAEESVAVHIRRTDFIPAAWTDDKSSGYYSDAITYFRRRLANPQFYFFSDDIRWAKSIFGRNDQYHYVQLVGGVQADIEELMLMAACRHHILTNKSTYGWWGAFLAPYSDGINICNGNDLDAGIPNLIIYDDTMMSKTEYFIKGIDEPTPSDICDIPDIPYIDLLENRFTTLLKEVNSQKSYSTDAGGEAFIKIDEVLSMADRLLPQKRDDYKFFNNYSLALFLAGRTYEAALYAANSKRLNATQESPGWLAGCDDTIKALYNLLCDKLCTQPPAHYFFLNINTWEYVKGFYDSLEIILRNLGNSVTLLECVIDSTRPDSSYEDIISSRTLLDVTYDYGIEKYDMHCHDDNSFFPCARQIINQIKTHYSVKVISHFAEGLICDVTPYPVYFIDGYIKWDVWKYLTDGYDDATFDIICTLSEKVFTARTTDDKHKNKIVRPYNLYTSQAENAAVFPRADVRQEDAIYTSRSKRAQDIMSNEIYSIKKPCTNYDCYMRNEDAIKEIIHIILNI